MLLLKVISKEPLFICCISGTESKDSLIENNLSKVMPVPVSVGPDLICRSGFLCGGQPWFCSEGATSFPLRVSAWCDSSSQGPASDTDVTLLQCILEVAMQPTPFQSLPPDSSTGRCICSLRTAASSTSARLGASEFWSTSSERRGAALPEALSLAPRSCISYEKHHAVHWADMRPEKKSDLLPCATVFCDRKRIFWFLLDMCPCFGFRRGLFWPLSLSQRQQSPTEWKKFLRAEIF